MTIETSPLAINSRAGVVVTGVIHVFWGSKPNPRYSRPLWGGGPQDEYTRVVHLVRTAAPICCPANPWSVNRGEVWAASSELCHAVLNRFLSTDSSTTFLTELSGEVATRGTALH